MEDADEGGDVAKGVAANGPSRNGARSSSRSARAPRNGLLPGSSGSGWRPSSCGLAGPLITRSTTSRGPIGHRSPSGSGERTATSRTWSSTSAGRSATRASSASSARLPSGGSSNAASRTHACRRFGRWPGSSASCPTSRRSGGSS